MFDILQSGSGPNTVLSDPGEDGSAVVPLERLEAQICELAGHLAAATCRFPGCESRRVDLHHIQYWSNGGCTKLDNLVSLCKYHHMLVHDRGYLIAAARDGTFAFYRPDGAALPASPALPAPDGSIGDCHDADITPDTIIPPWYGERLDLDHAIYVCFANAANQARQHDNAPPPVQVDQPDQSDQYEPIQPGHWGPIEPQDWMPSLRRAYTTS